MSTYELLLTIHVLAAAVWVGGSVMLLALGAYVARSEDVVTRVKYTRWTEWIAPRLFAPTLIVLIIAGVLLVDEAGFEFDQSWITLGFIGWFINFGIGVAFYGPEGKRRDRAIEQHGVEHADVARSVDRVMRVAGIDTLVSLLVVIDMTTKPGL
jgi:uncharacterized membrane protein